MSESIEMPFVVTDTQLEDLAHVDGHLHSMLLVKVFAVFQELSEKSLDRFASCQENLVIFGSQSIDSLFVILVADDELTNMLLKLEGLNLFILLHLIAFILDDCFQS